MTSTRNSKTDRRAEITQKLSDGISALVTTGAWQAYLDVQARFRTYSFGNTMLIMAQCPHATRVMSYGKKDGSTGWLSLGRNVIKGERAIWIWAPATRKTEDEETGEVKRSTFFVPVPVFDVSQTEGAELPEPVKRLTGEAPAGLLDRVVAFIESQGFSVAFVPFIDHPASQVNGRTSWAGKSVLIATDGRDTMAQFKTALHEAAHVLMHEGEGSNGRNELEAESVAYIAAATLGADTSGYSFGYVLGWMQGDPEAARKMIRTCGTRIQQAARRITDELPELTSAEVAA